MDLFLFLLLTECTSHNHVPDLDAYLNLLTCFSLFFFFLPHLIHLYEHLRWKTVTYIGKWLRGCCGSYCLLEVHSPSAVRCWFGLCLRTWGLIYQRKLPWIFPVFCLISLFIQRSNNFWKTAKWFGFSNMSEPCKHVVFKNMWISHMTG